MVTLVLLQLVPFPVGKTKSVLPTFDIGPETKLLAEPLVEVAPVANARIFVALVYTMPEVRVSPPDTFTSLFKVTEGLVANVLFTVRLFRL